MVISLTRFELVGNVFSFTIAAMGIVAAFTFLQRREVLPQYRAVVVILGLVALVAT